MTTEQKAIAYDEAIRKAKALYDNESSSADTLIACEVIFPELSESKDERIRKELIEHIKANCETGFLLFQKFSPDKIIAWLEKQEELKSSKWTEGDVVRHGGVLALVTNGRKAMKSNCEQIIIQYPDEWVKAETKERKYFFEELEKQGEQKSAWSESDMSKVQRICKYLNEAKKYYADINEVRECIDWLKSIQDRILPQPKQEWSKKDEQGYKDVDWCTNKAFQACYNEDETGTCWFAQRWVNSIKQRLGGGE